MKRRLISIIVLLFLFSCSGNKAFYNISINKVELSNDVKQSSDAKISNIYSNGKSVCKYEDDKIKISWELLKKQLNFTLLNKGSLSIKILWNDAVYVDENNSSSKVMHFGVKYINRNEIQPDAILAPNAKINDTYIPTKNIYFTRGEYGGWSESNLFKRNDKTLVGKHVRVLLPIEISGNRYEYFFTFNISNIAS